MEHKNGAADISSASAYRATERGEDQPAMSQV